MALSVRSEQSTKEGGLDVWLGRLGMVGFTAAIGVEIATGKGLLEVRHLLWTFYNQSKNDYLLAIATVVVGISVGFHSESDTGLQRLWLTSTSKLLKLLKVTVLLRLGLNLMFREVSIK